MAAISGEKSIGSKHCDSTGRANYPRGQDAKPRSSLEPAGLPKCRKPARALRPGIASQGFFVRELSPHAAFERPGGERKGRSTWETGGQWWPQPNARTRVDGPPGRRPTTVIRLLRGESLEELNCELRVEARRPSSNGTNTKRPGRNSSGSPACERSCARTQP